MELKDIDWDDFDREAEKWIIERNKAAIIRTSQLARLNDKGIRFFHDLINKIILKYDSVSYRNRWFDRHRYPEEYLYWFLLSYANKYGREATKKEYRKHGNMFTTEMYYINGYYFSRMDGQGCIIMIYKK